MGTILDLSTLWKNKSPRREEKRKMTLGCGVGVMPDKASSSEVQFRSEKLLCDSDGV